MRSGSWSRLIIAASKKSGEDRATAYALRFVESSDLTLEELVQRSGIRTVGVLAWRDLDDPEAGGSEVHADEIFQRWAAAGIDLTMRTSFAAGHPQVAHRNGYRVIRKAGRYMVFPRAAVSERLGWHGRHDVVLEIWNGMPFFSPVWSRVPIVTWLHHMHAEMWQMSLPPRLAAFGNAIESRFAPPRYRKNEIVTLSDSSRDELVGDLGFDPDRVSVVPPGIGADFSPGGQLSSEPLVVAVGRLVAVKRFDRLIRTLAPLKNEHPNLRLKIIGEGYERESLETLRSELGATDWIELPGRVSKEELVDSYRSAWLAVSMSAREGWGMTLTEAAACGTPCVATNIAGHRDAAAGGAAGVLVNSDDEFRSAVHRVLSEPNERARLSAGAIAHAAQLTWDNTARRTFEVMARAVAT